MPELLAVSVEILFALIDEVFLEMRARRHLARVSNHKSAIIFAPRNHHANPEKASDSRLEGKTLQSIREVTE